MTQGTTKETLLLQQPTVSKEEIAFLYAGDLWIAGRDGSYPRRLTAQKGAKSAPYFSPDGQSIAFSANYDGNTSVYLVSREGGSPNRLTYHPAVDFVRGWTPDGKRVLFASQRESISSRVRRLFSISTEGGLGEALPMHMAERGAYSPDGNLLAYTAYAEAFWSWKRYRGGMTVPIWVLDLKTNDYVQVPHENASDTFPCWVEDTLYFLSDRCGTMNVFRWKPGEKQVEQATHHTDFDVRSLKAGGGVLAYEQAGRLHLYDPASGQSSALSIHITADLPYTRPHYLKVSGAIQNADVSPTGLRAVFEARGELLTVPMKKGEVRNLTRTPGAANRFPAWSPDGQWIAYFSDESGEYQLIITDQKGEKKSVFSPGNPGFYYTPTWSPDSQKIAYTDKALHLYLFDRQTGTSTRIDSDTYDHPERTLNPAWSPDSRWIAYTRRLENQIRAVFLYSLEEQQPHQVTDGMSDATDACFSRDGKYLFFTVSSNYGLNTGWLDMSSYERPVLRGIYVAVLNNEDPSPLAPESDDEKASDEEKSTGEDQPSDEKKADSEKKEETKEGEKKKPKVPVVKIDLEGIDQRILALSVPARNYSRLRAAEGKLFYMEYAPNQPLSNQTSTFLLNAFDLKERKADVFVEKMLNYWVSADGKKVFYQAAEEPKFAIVGVEKKPEPHDGVLKLDGVEVYVEPRTEWKQIFREAFRIHRDFFYDSALHGLDLEAAYQKYLPFLDHVGHRDDLNFLMAEFSGELVVGHAYVGAGDIPSEEYVPVGLLGADYEVTPEGLYRIRRIYRGVNWHTELRAPLTEPGVNVREGEYILAVNGRPLRAPTSIYQLFEKTADRITELRVSPGPNEAEARTVTVRPVSKDLELRHWAWVEGNRRKVDELSNGRAAYVYMPDTAVGGYESFNRYYFSQLDKSAVVLDERFNGGGSIADYVVDLLNRPILSYWATREGKPFATPNASIFGPKVMIINELAGSGGDAMPLFFRRRGLGKLVGKRTWGGLIGIYDYPALIDGGFLTSPRMAIFSPQGEWEVENVGIAPDVEVEMTPKLVIEGHDPQLEKAVEIVLAELELAPPTKPARPAPTLKAGQLCELRSQCCHEHITSPLRWKGCFFSSTFWLGVFPISIHR